jgi:hypothetical protein
VRWPVAGGQAGAQCTVQFVSASGRRGDFAAVAVRLVGFCLKASASSIVGWLRPTSAQDGSPQQADRAAARQGVGCCPIVSSWNWR